MKLIILPLASQVIHYHHTPFDTNRLPCFLPQQVVLVFLHCCIVQTRKRPRGFNKVLYSDVRCCHFILLSGLLLLFWCVSMRQSWIFSTLTRSDASLKKTRCARRASKNANLIWAASKKTHQVWIRLKGCFICRTAPCRAVPCRTQKNFVRHWYNYGHVSVL